MIGLYASDSSEHIGALRIALGAGDVRAVQRAAHSLKSSGASFSARRLSQLYSELERGAL